MAIYLKLISEGEALVLDPTDGTEVIAEAGDLFTGELDEDFFNFNTNVKGDPTEAQNVQVYEMTKNGTFDQIYRGLGTDLDALCLSQAQIIQFVRRYRKWIRAEGQSTFFLFKVNNEYYVAGVQSYNDFLDIFAYHFSCGVNWLAETSLQFVTPQLALAST